MTYRTPFNLDLNRRSVLKGVAASGLAAGLFGVASGPARAAPSRGGTFRVGVHDGSSTDSWDPATTASILMIHSSHVARAYLTEITNENTLGPTSPPTGRRWPTMAANGASTWRATPPSMTGAR